MKTGPDRQFTVERRQLLKFAGAAVAGGLGSTSVAAQPGAANRGGMPGETLDIAIIGAGLSGLTTARDLDRAGNRSFVVLEARERVGGRTLNFDAGNGFISEVGGQWMGPGQTAIADLARQLEIDTFPTYYAGKTVAIGGNGYFAMDLDGSFGTDMKLGDELSKMARDVPCGAPWTSPRVAEFDKLSVGDWLARHNIKPEDQMGWQSSVTLSGGTAPARMGLLHYLSMINSANSKFEELDSIKHSAQETRFVGGSQALCIRMAGALGDRVRLGCPVRKISGWDGEEVTIETDRGVVRARQVIMALSPPLCNQIAFDPPLPEARAALQRAWPAHSPARKIAMVYSRPFWREKGLNGSIFQYGGPIIWAFDNSPPGGEIGIINAFVENGSLPLDPAATRKILSEIYAQALGDEALKPTGFHDQDWGQDDPWTLTCVSAIPPGFWSKHGEALHPPSGKLLWSGTETAEIWAGYMDGAVRAGQTAALQALGALRKS